MMTNNSSQDKWNNFLMDRALAGDCDGVLDALEAGADINADDSRVLYRVAARGHKEVARLLIECGAKVTDQSLAMAARSGHSGMVRLLLKHGAKADANGSEALRDAAWHGHQHVVRTLLIHGADVHAGQDAPLYMAAVQGHLEVVELLLGAGADALAEDCAALCRACHHERSMVVNAIIRHVFNPDRWGQSAPDAIAAAAAKMVTALDTMTVGGKKISSFYLDPAIALIHEQSALTLHAIRRAKNLAHPIQPKPAQPPKLL